jgi:segregation and condensation protein B
MKIESVIEAALFCSEEPLSAQRLKSLFPEENQPNVEEIRAAIENLRTDYAERGINLFEVASGFQFQSAPGFADFWQRMHEKRPPKASKSYLETLAIIAYKQPVTRGDIEQVRGVTVNTHIIRSLEERGWIKCLGFRDVPGRPAIYGTTKEFLDAFALKSLSALPDLKDVMDFDKVDEKISAQLEMAISGVSDSEAKVTALAADDTSISDEIILAMDQMDIEENDAKLDAAYESATELFANCDALLQKANPSFADDLVSESAEDLATENCVESTEDLVIENCAEPAEDLATEDCVESTEDLVIENCAESAEDLAIENCAESTEDLATEDCADSIK